MDQTPIKLGGIYQHYKGRKYKLHQLVFHSETLEELVYYECLYPNPQGQFWVRPKSMFFGIIDNEGQAQPRFRLVE